MSKFPIFFGFLIFSAGICHAETITTISKESKYLIIPSNIAEYSEPTDKRLTIQNILADSIQSEFTPIEKGSSAVFMSKRGHWKRFAFQSQISAPFVFEIQDITMDEVECYVVQESGNVVDLPPVNWRIPEEERSIETYRNVFLLSIDSAETVEVYVRLKKNIGSLRTYFWVWKEEAFIEDTHRELVIFGFLSGTLIFIIVSTLLLYVGTAETKYLYYSMYVLSVGLWRFTIEGYLLTFISKYFPSYSNPTYGNFWLITTAIFSAMFLKSFVLNKGKSPRWHFQLANLSIFLTSLFLCLFLLFGLNVFSSILIGWFFYMVMSMCIFNGVYFSISGMRRGEINSYIYFFSNIIFLLYSAILAGANLGLLPNFSAIHFSLIWALFIEIILLSIGLGIDFRSQLLQRKDLLLEVSEQKRIALEATNQLQLQTIKTIQAENILRHEKGRISSDLHDSIGSDLSNIIYNLDFISSKLKDSVYATDINQLQQFARNTMEQLRSAIWVLKQEQVSVDDFGHKLRSYISKHLHHYDSLIYTVDIVEGTGTYILPTTHALYLYRIVQEALNNTMKYAQASLFSIRFETLQNGKLSVIITDNGIGFSTAESSKKESYGLENMAKRIESLQGEFSVLSAEGKGTTIKISIPFST